jgi:hypothetical protein
MATRIINSSVPVEVLSSGGIYLGDAIAYDVDGKRVSRVLSRIVRGIYFLERGVRVPENALAIGLADPPPESVHPETIQAVLKRRHCRAADGAFEYWFGLVDDRPDSAFILMRFFGGLVALGFVLDEPTQP